MANINYLNYANKSQMKSFYTKMTGNTTIPELKKRFGTYFLEVENTLDHQDKLYIDCPRCLKYRAKILGIKWDDKLKMWYLPKTTNKADVKELFMLKELFSEFGEPTTPGYQKFEYKIIFPKFITFVKEFEQYIVGSTSGSQREISMLDAVEMFNDNNPPPKKIQPEQPCMFIKK